MKNVLFLGLGSIGQRHFRNLKSIDNKINFFCIRTKNNSPELNNNLKVIKKKFDPKFMNIREINWRQIKDLNIDTAFVTNPTSLHVKTALKLTEYNLNLYIEKPLSNNLDKIYLLRNIIKKKNLKCEIGFQTRYDDLLFKVRDIIKSKKFGDIIKSNISHCHYLPNHHKYENYKDSYASNKRLGGGVLLCFSHEIDYATYLFGKPKKIIPISISSGKLLDINVETSAQFSIEYKSNVVTTFNLDFIKKDSFRKCQIQFEKAYLDWNLNTNKLTIENNKKIIISKVKKRNNLFLKSIKKVRNNFSKNKNSFNTFENALLNLKTIIQIKKSLTKKKIIKL